MGWSRGGYRLWPAPGLGMFPPAVSAAAAAVSGEVEVLGTDMTAGSLPHGQLSEHRSDAELLL